MLSANGARIARILFSADFQAHERHITDISGMVDVLDDTAPLLNILLLSPDGSEYADVANLGRSSAATRVYRNGALVTGIDGSAAGWLDDGRLLVGSYSMAARFDQCAGSTIYDPTGKALSPPMSLGACGIFDYTNYIPPDGVYSWVDDTIHDLRTLNAVWKGPGWTMKTRETRSVAGDSIAYIVGREIRRVKYR